MCFKNSKPLSYNSPLLYNLHFISVLPHTFEMTNLFIRSEKQLSAYLQKHPSLQTTFLESVHLSLVVKIQSVYSAFCKKHSANSDESCRVLDFSNKNKVQIKAFISIHHCEILKKSSHSCFL